MTSRTMRFVVPLALLGAVVGAVLLLRGWFDQRAKEEAARLGIDRLQKAVQEFRLSKGDYPPDLDTMTRPLDSRPAPLEQPDLADPWGRPYVYEPENRHPASHTPRIYSRGADPEDPSAVISNW